MISLLSVITSARRGRNSFKRILVGDDTDQRIGLVHYRNASMRCSFMMASASPPGLSERVTGLDHAAFHRFTQRTSAACSAMVMFLWMTPIPPWQTAGSNTLPSPVHGRGDDRGFGDVPEKLLTELDVAWEHF